MKKNYFESNYIKIYNISISISHIVYYRTNIDNWTKNQKTIKDDNWSWLHID